MTDTAECRGCPICQLLSVLSPEVVEHLTAAGAELMMAFRAATPARRREPSPVERIDIA